MLLAAGTTLVRAASDDETKGGRYAHFNGMFFMVVFVAAVFLVGKITGALGAPSLVGEILVGVLLGPPVLDFVPNPGVLMLVGEVGLVLLVVEAGLHVDVEMLEIIGARGLAVGLLGSALPLALALTAAYFWGATLVEAFAVGACMATMSTGIALNVIGRRGDARIEVERPTHPRVIPHPLLSRCLKLYLVFIMSRICTESLG